VRVTGWKQLGLVVEPLEGRDPPSALPVEEQSGSRRPAKRSEIESHVEEL
jgi:hypothetical protein